MRTFVLVILVFCFTSTYSTAQNKVIDATIIECNYLEEVVIDTLSRHLSIDTMLLRVGANCSSFYSRRAFFVDSLQGSPGGSAKFMRWVSGNISQGRCISSSNTAEYFYQNYPKGSITTRSRILADPIEIVESRENLEWQLVDSIKVVAGYECKLAIAPFRGRVWSAWYTLEIPIDFGPWKLHGLPGLILEAYDLNSDYHYTLIGLSNAEPEGQVVLYNLRNYTYKKAKRISYLRRYDDLLNMSTADMVQLTTADSKQAGMFSHEAPSVRYDFRERDYR